MTTERARHALPAVSRALFWLGLVGVTVGSLLPVALLPPQAFDVWDKAQHALGFAWLAAWGMPAWPQRRLAVVSGLVVWGGVIEWLQAASGWRHGDAIDWLADAIGVALGVAAWRCLSTAWSRRA